MGQKRKPDIPDWFEDRMRKTLGHLKWVLGDESQSVTVDANELSQDVQSVVSAVNPLFHPTVVNRPDEDRIFYNLMLNAVSQNNIDITYPKKVGVRKVFTAYQEQKEQFVALCENDTNFIRRYKDWEIVKAQL